MVKIGHQRRWSIEKRLGFIDFQLFWYGQINRSDIRDKFGVSAPQASTDLSLYGEIAPKNLIYDLSEKKYLASDSFKPAFIRPEAEPFLWQLRDDVHSVSDADGISLRNLPSHDIIRFPKRNIDPFILRTVSGAVRERKTIEIFYQSMSSEEPSWRGISPHAFAFDGHRWHVRSFCHNGLYYKDFLLSRIQKIGKIKDEYISAEADTIWHEFFTVILKPNPKLSISQAKAVAADYNMCDMKLNITMRLALLYYFLRRLELQDCDGEKRDPKEQHVVLENKEETKLALSRTF